MRKTVQVAIFNIILFVLLLVLLEGVLHLMRDAPYQPPEQADISVASGEQFFQKDSILGYKHRPGNFELQLQNGTYCFQATHDQYSLRNTSDQRGAEIKRNEIWLFGCSFTYGWSLSDEETFAWKLQSMIPEYRVVNWGVNGYGTIHFYLQLNQALTESNKPSMIVVNHADFHHERDINTYNYHRSISMWNEFAQIKRPYVYDHSEDALDIRYVGNNYQPWEVATKYILGKYGQFIYERIWDGLHHKESLRTTACILDHIQKLCTQHGITLVVANVGVKKKFIQSYVQERKLPYVDLAVDYRQKKWTNLPYDKHPNARAHDWYAGRLATFLEPLLAESISEVPLK